MVDKSKQEEAAVKIQSVYKGSKQRKDLQREKEEEDALMMEVQAQ